MNRNGTVHFITGATGSVGSILVRRLLSTGQETLALLVRSRAGHSAQERMEKILGRLRISPDQASRIEIVEGDITQRHLGLSAKRYEELACRVRTITHAAALTSLNAPWEDCRKINVEGTANVLAFAERARHRGALSRLNHFSTAYVVGSERSYHRLHEEEIPESPPFANPYERSKHEAELLVRHKMREGLPTTIFRPSIVVGDSTTGEIPDFNVIYPFVRLLVHGFLSKLPARSESSCNIVPIDFVTEASLAISQMPESLGKTYHLVTDNPPTIGLMLALKDAYTDQIPIEIIEPDKFREEDLTPEEALVFAKVKPYLVYLNQGLEFDSTNTKRALAKTNIHPPNTDVAFLGVIFDYAIRAGYLLRPDDHGAST